jgi:hypothetical protein
MLCLVAIIGFVAATILSLIGSNFSTHSPFAGIFMLIDGAPFNDALMPLMSLVLFITAIFGFFTNLSSFKK